VSESLKGFDGIILAAGRCDVGLESSVLDVTGEAPLLLRPGAITAEELSQRLGVPVLSDFEAKSESDQPRSPGQTLRHYAPNTPIRLRAVDVEQGEALLGFGSEKFIGIRGGGRVSDLPQTHHMNLSEGGDLNEAAANLFAMLRALDKAGASRIAVMDIPKTGLGIAMNERLQRAAEASASV
jgi:L-threonylcarbamoyladenylate synthase